MKNIILIICLSSLAPFVTQAQTPNAIDDAIEACEKFTFEKDECLGIVNAAEFYQSSLVRLCMGLTGMSSDKMSCLQLVGKKTANEKMVQVCDKKTWWDKTKSCLGSALKPYTAATPTPTATSTPSPTASPHESKACNRLKVRDTLNLAIEQCKNHKYLTLYETLIDLRAWLRDCDF